MEKADQSPDALLAQIAELKKQLHDSKTAHQLFLHKVSHDLKTPANEILFALNYLKHLSLKDDAMNVIDSGQAACLQLNRLLEQLITLDELDNNRTMINRQEFSLVRMLEILVQQAKDQILASDKQDLTISVHWHHDPEPLQHLLGDKDKLRKILTELVFNAIEHSDTGNIQITIESLENRANSAALQISVRDQGKGMTADQLSKILTPFAHYKDFFHGQSDKAGLSLMLCQKLTHLMAGTLTVESSASKGTCVSIKMGFPLARQPYYLRPDEQPVRYIQSTDKPLMVVDDNPVNRSILCAIARRLGFETQQASNGQEALQLFDRTDFALIFMDCQMPIMNGFEAAHQLRQVKKTSIPVIAVTANTTDEDMQKCYSAGMNDILAKPVTPNTVAEALSRWLKEVKRDLVQDM